MIVGDPVLHAPTQPVIEDVSELRELAEDMYETMDRAHGAGSATNQVGVGKRPLVYNYPDDDDVWHRGRVINPALTTGEIPKTMPNDDGSDDEDCLSVPGLSLLTNCAEKVVAIGLDENGKEVRIEAIGFFTRCMQYGVGRLDRFLYTDCLTSRRKRMAKEKIKCTGWAEGGLTWMPGVDPNPFGHEDQIVADRQLESSASENVAQKLPISRWGVGEVAVGRRAIVRCALTDEEALVSGKETTDVIGHALSVDLLIVRSQVRTGVRADESVVAVDFGDKHTLIAKALPDHLVCNSDICAVKIAIVEAFPGIAYVVGSGWLLRAGDGITERFNSALPLELGVSTQLMPLEKIKSFYDSHDLPVRIAVPDRIAKPAQALVVGSEWTVGPDAVVMARSFDGDSPPVELGADSRSAEQVPDEHSVERVLDSHSAEQVLDSHSAELANVQADVADQPDDNWLGSYHFRGTTLPEHALRLLCNEIDGRMCSGRLQVSGDNVPEGTRTVAITYGTSIESDDSRVWPGFPAVEIATNMRRRGFGTLLGIHMMHRGAQHGVDSAYLQVLGLNEAGIALYRTLGFTEYHRYCYVELTGAQTSGLTFRSCPARPDRSISRA